MQIHNTYGIDLGTSTVKIYDLKKDTITKEKNMIAIRNKEQLLAVGNDAYEMHERTPSNIEIITPMSNGRIANVLMVEAVLHTLLCRCGSRMGYRPELYFSAPAGMTEIEKRSYYAIAHRGRLKNCRMYLVDKPIADALALGIPINKTKGSMIVNIGAQSTDISVIADARVIFSKLIPIGGRQFNEAISFLNRKRNNFQIGAKTAKRLKIALADLENDRMEARKVRGVDGTTGLPVEGIVTSSLVNEAVTGRMMLISEEIKLALERTPPQIHRHILSEGIYITGGSTRLANMDRFLTRQLGCAVQLSQYYDLCTICGLKELITHDALHKWAYTVKKHNHR